MQVQLARRANGRAGCTEAVAWGVVVTGAG